MMNRTACMSLVMIDGLIVAIECQKGNGLSLPGGKWEFERGESFMECAARELKEEAGLTTISQELLFHGMGVDRWYNYCFIVRTDWKPYTKYSGDNGPIQLVRWSDLLSSRFRAYYELVYHAWRNSRAKVD